MIFLDWLRGLVALLLFVGFLELLLPDNEMQGLVRLFLGLLIIAVVLEPLTHLFSHSFAPQPLLSIKAEDEHWHELKQQGEAVHQAGMAVATQATQAEYLKQIQGLATPLGLVVQRVEVESHPNGQLRLAIWLGAETRPSEKKGAIAVKITPITSGGEEDSGQAGASETEVRFQQMVAAVFGLPVDWVILHREGQGDD